MILKQHDSAFKFASMFRHSNVIFSSRCQLQFEFSNNQADLY